MATYQVVKRTGVTLRDSSNYHDRRVRSEIVALNDSCLQAGPVASFATIVQAHSSPMPATDGSGVAMVEVYSPEYDTHAWC